jgi:hypothetical protein
MIGIDGDRCLASAQACTVSICTVCKEVSLGQVRSSFGPESMSLYQTYLF